MKLIRFGEKGSERPGMVLRDGSLIDCSIFGEDYDENFFGDRGLKRLRRWAATFATSSAARFGVSQPLASAIDTSPSTATDPAPASGATSMAIVIVGSDPASRPGTSAVAVTPALNVEVTPS